MLTSLTEADVQQMRDQVFFEGAERNRRLSRYWLLLLLSTVIASAGVVSDSTATVIGAMIIAPLMTPILGTVLAVVLTDRANLRRCLLLLAAGAAAVVAVSWLLGHLVPYPVTAATNSQVASRVTPRIVDLVAALATGSVGSIALARPDIEGYEMLIQHELAGVGGLGQAADPKTQLDPHCRSCREGPRSQLTHRRVMTQEPSCPHAGKACNYKRAPRLGGATGAAADL